MNKSRRLEQFSINLSIAITILIATVGLTVGSWIRSDAVMLDGFFNLVSFFMALASLWITRILAKPEGKVFNFGYAGFVPLLNLCKGLMTFSVSIFAFAGSVGSLFRGGVQTKAGIAVFYALFAATVCLTVALYQRNLAKKSNSPIVQVDAQNWLINGMIGLSVGVAFSLVTWLEKSSFANLAPYADPVIVIILVSLAIPIPIKVILTSLKQLMLGAPELKIQDKAQKLIAETIKRFPCQKYVSRMTQAGEMLYLHLYWLLPDSARSMPLDEIDKIRLDVVNVLQQEFPNMVSDIIFTQDSQWFNLMNEERGAQSVEI